MRFAVLLVVLLTGMGDVSGQTLIDLRSQVKNVDFSGALSTKPFRSGVTLPLTCGVSEAFLKLNALPGQNIYICTSTNVWTLQGNSGGTWGLIAGTLSAQSDLSTALGLKAPLDSPTFSGRPTIPDFTLAPHSHLEAAGGGTLNAAAIAVGVLDIARLPTGTSSANVALGNHTHSGVYEPVDTALLRTSNLAGSGSATTPARSDHTHAGVYEPVDANILRTSNLAGNGSANTPARSDHTHSYDLTQISGTLAINKGGTGATSSGGALTSLGAAPVVHAHVLTDLVGISGKQGDGPFLQAFGGGAVNVNDCAKFDAAGNLISAGETCSGVPNYGKSFTSTVSLTMTHNLHSLDLLVQCYDESNAAIGFNSFIVTDANHATVTFANPQSGRCVLNASSGIGASDSVTNVSGPLPLDQPVFGNGGADVKAGSKTGSGNQVVVSQSPAIASPYITDFANMQHDHSGAAGGGQLGISAISPATRSGTGATIATTTGTLVSGTCAQFDSVGNITSSYAPCGTDSSDGGGSVISGLGLTGSGTSGSPLSVDISTVPTRLTGTATLGFASINASACSELAIPLTGATTGDEVLLGAPADIDQGFVWNGYVSSANTIKVRLCKLTAGSVTPVTRVWRATIIRSF